MKKRHRELLTNSFHEVVVEGIFGLIVELRVIGLDLERNRSKLCLVAYPFPSGVAPLEDCAFILHYSNYLEV